MANQINSQNDCMMFSLELNHNAGDGGHTWPLTRTPCAKARPPQNHNTPWPNQHTREP